MPRGIHNRGNGVTPEERLWSRVNKAGPTMPNMTTPCWLWTGPMFRSGYGQFKLNQKNVLAHRFTYELIVGPCPARPLEADHLCRNRACVNPDHLEFVTKRENQMRGIGFVPINAAKTHCKNGHEFTPENTVHYPGEPGHRRRCRTCIYAAIKRYKARKREAA